MERQSSARSGSDFTSTKPLPPIGSTSTTDSHDSDASVKNEEKSTDSVTGLDRPGEGSARPRIIRGFRPEKISDDEMDEDEEKKTHRSVSFTNGKQTTVKRKTYDGREITLVTLNTQTDWDWVENAEQTGTARTLGGNDKSITEEKEKLAQSPGSLSSKHDADDKGASVTPQYQMPYSDEYGIPILDLSSDTDDSSDEEISHKKTKNERIFIPSVGPPNILQKSKRRQSKSISDANSYQRESEKHDIEVEDPESRLPTVEEKEYDKDDSGVTHGMFSGNCEFCNKPIKPFPSLDQQVQFAPELLYCCTEYREFVEYVINTTTNMENEQKKKNKMINIKPHEHVGSKQERNAAKEKAVQRMRERELQRRQQEASGMQQNFFASAQGGGGTVSKAGFMKLEGRGNVTMKDMFGPAKVAPQSQMAPMSQTVPVAPPGSNAVPIEVNVNPSKIRLECLQDCPSRILKPIPKSDRESPVTPRVGPEVLSKGGELIGRHSKMCSHFQNCQLGSIYLKALKRMVEVARQMKTINYQLSSQKCLEEGWTLRAPSPLMEDEGDDVFVPEPLNPAMIAEGKRQLAYRPDSSELQKLLIDRPLIEKFYESGQKFLTMFPDGTGNVFYPSGNLAILISAVKLGQYFYTIHQDIQRSGVVAVFEPSGFGFCYYPNGDVRLYIDQYGGIELDPVGGRKRKWSWKDQVVHVHAPPFQPICIGLNRNLGLRVMSQENIALTFSASQRSCRFNMGSRLKLVAPENIPLIEVEADHIYLEETKNHVNSILNKVANLLKFPNSPNVDKMLPPLHITSKAKKMEKLKEERQMYLAQQTARDKKQSVLSVN